MRRSVDIESEIGTDDWDDFDADGGYLGQRRAFVQRLSRRLIERAHTRNF
jgi:hypothetical protein